MKRCSKCKGEKPTIEFRKRSKSRDGLSHLCKSCLDEISEKWRLVNKDKRNDQNRVRVELLRRKFDDWKSSRGCIVCGESTPCCLDMHHTDPKVKEGNPSNFVNYGWERLMEEAEKCVVVCRNCHAKIHAGMIDIQGLA